MQIFIISDLHLGHDKILEFSPERFGRNIHEHDEWLVSQWNKVVSMDDKVYVLGDVTFERDSLNILKRMCGNKFLVRGNHDKFNTALYLKYFQEVYGLIRKSQFWLSHAPIHPGSLRGSYNIHGHTHSNNVKTHDGKKDDPRYINVSVEQNYGIPVNFTKMIKSDKYK